MKRLDENKLNSIVKDAVKTTINESSLNRIISWMNKYDIACISAFRDAFENATPNTLDDRKVKMDGYKYTREEKEERNRKLKASLLAYGYGVTSINGNYIENFGTIKAREVGEKSFFVVNIHNDENFEKNIFALSEYYNQDCFLYKPKGSNVAYNIGTNTGDYPGYGKADCIGNLHISIDSEFLSRVGNASFAFSKEPNTTQDKRNYNFNSRKQDRIKKSVEAPDLDIYENYSRGSRMTIKAIHQDFLNEMKKNH